MKCVVNEKGKIIKDQPGIMRELSKFYRELYSAD